jgi:Phosphotransferase enzyme family
MSLTSIWAFTILQDLGYRIQNPVPQAILQIPWSSVYRFDTDQGSLYLKQVPPGLSKEPQVVHLLQETCEASVPLVIAENPQLCCFLMQDAGITLREYFKQSFNADLLLIAISNYIVVQRKSIPHLDLLFNLDAFDWRIANLPACYTLLINQKGLLIADGLTDTEIKQLSSLTSKLVSLCEQLSQYPIPDTFSHNDFHDNNLLIDSKTKKITLVDLGEVAVTHPFFSLLNMLHQVKEKHALQEEVYQHLQLQALQFWLDYAPQDQLLAVMSLIQQCWPVHRALTEYRLLTSIEATSASQLLGKGRFFRHLRVWLAQ